MGKLDDDLVDQNNRHRQIREYPCKHFAGSKESEFSVQGFCAQGREIPTNCGIYCPFYVSAEDKNRLEEWLSVLNYA